MTENYLGTKAEKLIYLQEEKKKEFEVAFRVVLLLVESYGRIDANWKKKCRQQRQQQHKLQSNSAQQ